jgi:hypothetical protein
LRSFSSADFWQLEHDDGEKTFSCAPRPLGLAALRSRNATLEEVRRRKIVRLGLAVTKPPALLRRRGSRDPKLFPDEQVPRSVASGTLGVMHRISWPVLGPAGSNRP